MAGIRTPAKNDLFCLVSGKQREPQQSRKAKRGANSGEDEVNFSQIPCAPSGGRLHGQLVAAHGLRLDEGAHGEEQGPHQGGLEPPTRFSIYPELFLSCPKRTWD